MKKLKMIFLTILVLVAGMVMAGCNITVSGEDVEFDVGEERESSTEEINLDDVTAVKADIYDTVGSVSVEYSEDSSVDIDVKYKIRGNHENELLEILDVVKTEAVIEEDVLKIKVVNKITNENMWEWIEDEYGIGNKPDLSVEMDIALPASIQEFDIKCDVGNIDLDSLTGEFDVTNNVGNVKATNINFTKDSNITVDVGDITCKLSKDLSEETEVSLTVNVGSINLDTEDLPYTTENTNGSNFIGTSETILVNDLCNIDTRISVGKLSLR